MKLAFMGTPDFAVPVLAALIAAGHEIAAVYSQPPRPAGRGHKEQLSPVHAFAAERGLMVRCPKSLKSPDQGEAFAALGLDAAVVAAYGLILPPAILAAPRWGCLNVHASLLPRWRGAAPIQRALLAGDGETGVTIMQMDAGLDTGAMLLAGRVAITAETDARSLHDSLSALGAGLIVEALARLPDLLAIPQPGEGITYAAKLDKEEGRIDWTKSAAELDRLVRALNPWPGVWCDMAGERLKVLAARPVEGRGRPGQVLAPPLVVACGDGALALTRVQRAGRAPMRAEDLLRGCAVPPGSMLGS